MFSITTRSKYGIAALLEMAKQYGQGLLNVKEIADKKNISPQYLEQLLNRSMRSGFVRAVRGQKGGYVLARPPQEITLMEIFETLEGPLEIANDLGPDNVLNGYFKETEKQVRQSLDVPLADALARERDQAIMFYI